MNLAGAFDSLANRRVIFFGGKGGVGKTTVSCLAALHYAQKRKVILFTTDPASNLRDLFPRDRATPRPRDLVIEELDAEKLYARFLKKNLDFLLEIGDRGTYLDRDELRRFFELSIPGVDEIMAWMRIGELAEENAEALIVVDTAPTGHALRMLAAGFHVRQFAAALDALEEKHRGMVRQLTRRDVRDKVDEFIESFERDARRRHDLLTNPATSSFVPVFLSEPWVVEQTIRLINEVRDDGIDIPVSVLNRAVGKPDCALCRKRLKREETARERLAPLAVVDAVRSCVPIDSVEALRKYLGGALSADRVPESGGMATALQTTFPLPPAKLVFLAGKGGVGKTTCAASIALQLAGKHPDRRYTLISVDPAHAVRDVFAKEKPPNNLTVETIDTRAKWQHLRESLSDEIERAVNAITPGNLTLAYDADAMRKLLEIAPPGADEIFAVTRLADLAQDQSQAMVIVDTAPTGHFLRLLELPHTAGEWVREFMRILLRYRELIPAGSLGQDLVNASRSLTSLEQTLHADRTAVIVVTRPERIVVAETKRLIDDLNRRNIRLASIIANYVTPGNQCPCDQSMRAHELRELASLGDVLLIPRREEPVTGLGDLARLFTVAAD